MTRQYWLDLTPSLLVGAGIVASTFVAVRTAQSGWSVLAGPLLMALAVVTADALASRLRGAASRPSPAALLLAGSFLVAALIVTPGDPKLVTALIPTLGTASWVAILLRPESRRKTCKSV